MSSSTKNTVIVNGETSVVTVAVPGPQGPAGSGLDLDSTNKVDGSIIYYDSTSAKFKADATTTKLTLVNGGNFQVMSNTIRIKKRSASGSAGAPSSLSPSELAFNEADLKLYYGFGDNGSTPPSASSIITVGGSGAFFNKTDTRAANTVLSGPTSGSDAAPAFRALVVADIPTLTASKVSDFDTQVRTNRLDQLASATNPVSGVTPTADAHFATKAYVDSTSEGLDVKQSCKVATTANITLSGTQTIDGVAVSADERVLVKDQSTASENGIYLCKASSWVRSDDLATGANAAGAFTFVEQGSTNADIGFVCTTDTATVGTNNLSFSTFSSSGNVTAGNGLDKVGNELSLDLKANGGLVIESTELALDLAASSITGTLPVTKLTSLTATVTELNKLDGLNSTTTELNTCTDGDTSATSTTLAAADRMVVNDNGTMVQVALTDLVTFLENGSVSGLEIDGGTY